MPFFGENDLSLEGNPTIVGGVHPFRRIFLGCLSLLAMCQVAGAEDKTAVRQFHQSAEPVLLKYCSDCHADGMKKGGVAFDQFKTDAELITNRELWTMVLKNVRGGIMPPPKKPHPSPEEQQKLVDWIKFGDFGINPKNPDPGRVTVRRLNRIEYRNTIRDLIGVTFDTDEEFPPDDTGYGFDDIGDVLTLSPILLEKYFNAAKTIISEAVPVVPKVMPEQIIPGGAFRRDGGGHDHNSDWDPLRLSYYEKAAVSNRFTVSRAGAYQVILFLTANEQFVDNEFDSNQCRMIFKIDGEPVVHQQFGREGNKEFRFAFDRDWAAGPHDFAVEVAPLTPDAEQVRALNLRIQSVTLRGPSDPAVWVRPKNYHRFFPRDVVPAAPKERRAYAEDLLRAFATKAYRRPVDEGTLQRLTTLAETTYQQPGVPFEAGVAHAMIAVLASPQFLFRQEEAIDSAQSSSLVDEYSLASRLSYFLWSTMPDAELIRLAGKGELRKNLGAQVQRMLADPRAEALSKNFTGQWLQARDIETVQIEARSVLMAQDKKGSPNQKLRERYHELRDKDHLTPAEKNELESLRTTAFKMFRRYEKMFTGDLRHDLRHEVEMYFANIVHTDGNVLDLVQSDYTFLNERLARFYGLTNLDITGDRMRRVTLPPDSPRGGVLTMGSVLAVTSNPTRTSPVKRGLFILENILGNPVPPPPPNLPALEDAEKEVEGREPTLREVLAMHRAKPLCASCHNRMDPLGLALENFNAMGMWRATDHGQPIDCAGTLLSGESFKNIQELKEILASRHRDEFYRTLTEKMLIYALGRGLEYYDTGTVDEIAGRLAKENGRFSVLLNGVIESAPFQMRRNRTTPSEADATAAK
ncbi:MAG TPA: DUF1592 domain-containing protein [Candidatus Saccharimonadales bacterium]|nr:DUF1592 domain-containing protein [Candidatus Saccharimonadales bacterium]